MSEQYCIGKATRYQENDIVKRPPYRGEPNDVPAMLRASLYTTQERAELACKLAATWNPVGFVVLIVEDVA